MKTLKLCLAIAGFICVSCGKSKKSEVPDFFPNLQKRYPKLFPYGDFSDYHFVREIFNNDDSLKMRLYDRTNSGDEIVEFINKMGKYYAFPIPSNSDSTYWRFYGDTAHYTSVSKTFQAEVQNAFKTLSLDDGWLAERTFEDLAVSLLQTRIVMSHDDSAGAYHKNKRSDCDTPAEKGLKEMYSDALVVLGLTANTFYDYNHGRYYQFDSNMPSEKKGFSVTVFR